MFPASRVEAQEDLTRSFKDRAGLNSALLPQQGHARAAFEASSINRLCTFQILQYYRSDSVLFLRHKSPQQFH